LNYAEKLSGRTTRRSRQIQGMLQPKASVGHA
jgi:hypothetical protein